MKQLFYFFTGIFLISSISCAQPSRTSEIPAETVLLQDGLGVATFAGGCFWCVEAVFERVKGVEDAVSGYSGGKEKDPTYKQVSYGRTSHAEAVQITYDPDMVSYEDLVTIFFATIDPTQLNRQGPDVGAQYRSIVFYHNEEQQKIAEQHIKKLSTSGKYNKEIVTTVEPYDIFYVAEDYHQNFYELNPNQPYVVNVTRPKVEKFLKLFPDKLKDKYKKSQ